MKSRILTFCLLLSALWLAAWNPKPQVSSRLRYPLAVAVVDTDSIVRNVPVPLTKGDTARRYIKLLPGFEVNPQNGQFYVATIDTANNSSQVPSCPFRLSSVNSKGDETELMPRQNGTLQNLSLSVKSLDGTPLTNVSLLWSVPNGVSLNPANNNLVTATKIGNYGVRVIRNNDTCNFNITIHGQSCNPRMGFYNGCQITSPIVNQVSNPLQNLALNDTIFVNDFHLKVLHISGGNSTLGWSGRGAVSMTLFGGLIANVSVIFQNVQINECYEFVGGSIVTEFDPFWENEPNFTQTTRGILNNFQDVTNLLLTYRNTPDDQLNLNKLQSRLTESKSEVQSETELDVVKKQEIINKIESFFTCSNQIFPTITGRLGATQQTCSLAEKTNDLLNYFEQEDYFSYVGQLNEEQLQSVETPPTATVPRNGIVKPPVPNKVSDELARQAVESLKRTDRLIPARNLTRNSNQWLKLMKLNWPRSVKMFGFFLSFQELQGDTRNQPAIDRARLLLLEKMIEEGVFDEEDLDEYIELLFRVRKISLTKKTFPTIYAGKVERRLLNARCYQKYISGYSANRGYRLTYILDGVTRTADFDGSTSYSNWQ